MNFVPKTTLKKRRCGYIYCGEWQWSSRQLLPFAQVTELVSCQVEANPYLTSALCIYSSLCFHTYSLLPNSVRNVAGDYHSLYWLLGELSDPPWGHTTSVVGPGPDPPSWTLDLVLLHSQVTTLYTEVPMQQEIWMMLVGSKISEMRGQGCCWKENQSSNQSRHHLFIIIEAQRRCTSARQRSWRT